MGIASVTPQSLIPNYNVLGAIGAFRTLDGTSEIEQAETERLEAEAKEHEQDQAKEPGAGIHIQMDGQEQEAELQQGLSQEEAELRFDMHNITKVGATTGEQVSGDVAVVVADMQPDQMRAAVEACSGMVSQLGADSILDSLRSAVADVAVQPQNVAMQQEQSLEPVRA
tara:strand:- start:759 stop:1265 length:507 start_codon:yes stop_codon:yes gene_type:complete